MAELVGSPPPADLATSALRVPPHSIDAEQSVLGGLMIDNTVWEQILDQIVKEDFYRKDHRLIFSAIHALSDDGHPFDVITVSEWLRARDDLDDAGGLAYLGTLAKNTPSAANIGAYANIVRERSILRSLIAAGAQISSSGFNTEGRSADELLDSAEQCVFQIAELGSRARTSFIPIKDVVGPVVERIHQLSETGGTLTGLASGFTDLDEKTSGLQPADLIIVAGRPSMGKTSFAMNMVEHAAINGGAAVAIFSMEMPAEQLTMRMLASLGRIDQHKVRTGQLADNDWPRITSALQLLNQTDVFIDDTPALTPSDLRARCRRLTREKPLGLVVVDYLQLMRVPGLTDNRVGEISEISRSLKALAKELKVPVVALSQLNRGLEQRQDKRPVMSDLRESGAIEQDADVILFIYRDEVYREDSPDKGKAEIIIGKQRNGPIGKVTLAWLGQYTRFEDFIPGDYSSFPHQ